MKNKDIIIVAIFISLIVFTYYRLNLVNKDIPLEEKNNILEQRLSSLMNSKYLDGIKFPKIKMRNLISRNAITRDTIFEKKSIVVLLSNSGCNPCQKSTLEILEKLIPQMILKEKVIAVYLGEDDTDALLLRKVTQFLPLQFNGILIFCLVIFIKHLKL